MIVLTAGSIGLGVALFTLSTCNLPFPPGSMTAQLIAVTLASHGFSWLFSSQPLARSSPFNLYFPFSLFSLPSNHKIPLQAKAFQFSIGCHARTFPIPRTHLSCAKSDKHIIA